MITSLPKLFAYAAMIQATEALVNRFRPTPDAAGTNTDRGCQLEFRQDLIGAGFTIDYVTSLAASCKDPRTIDYSCWDLRLRSQLPERQVRQVNGLRIICKADEYCYSYTAGAYPDDRTKLFPSDRQKGECRPKSAMTQVEVDAGQTTCKQTKKVTNKVSKVFAFISKKITSKSGSSSSLGGSSAPDSVPGSILKVTEISASGQYVEVPTADPEWLDSTNIGSIYRICASIPSFAAMGLLSYTLETGTF